MNKPTSPPPPRKAGRAAIIVVVLLAAIMLAIFFGRNIWHGEELQENQEAGNNVAGNYQGQSNY